MPKMIFIYTGRLSDDPKAGSAVRPVRMLEAFKEIGYDIAEVTGYSAERKKTIAALRKEIRGGVKYDFCYMETTTMPIALGDPGHLPVRPFLDLRFISFLKRNVIPVFVFYRDCHWRFPMYGRNIGPIKKRAALAFYRMEFFWLDRNCDVMYLPAFPMDRYLPRGSRRIEILPPGCVPVPHGFSPHAGCLEILYVGGVTPPIYTLDGLLETVRSSPFLRLSIVCREAEAASLKQICLEIPNVRILHLNTAETRECYLQADVASLFLEPGEYFSMTLPVKLFEAIGYGVPILARSGTESGRFVAENGLGWVASGPEEARAVLRRLSERPEELEAARLRVREASARHTWAERARQVARDAEGIRLGPPPDFR